MMQLLRNHCVLTTELGWKPKPLKTALEPRLPMDDNYGKSRYHFGVH